MIAGGGLGRWLFFRPYSWLSNLLGYLYLALIVFPLFISECCFVHGHERRGITPTPCTVGVQTLNETYECQVGICEDEAFWEWFAAIACGFQVLLVGVE